MQAGTNGDSSFLCSDTLDTTGAEASSMLLRGIVPPLSLLERSDPTRGYFHPDSLAPPAPAGTDDGTEIIRVRKFHRRSRNGCEHCKKRRVRCDEKKPVCGNCIKKGSQAQCLYIWQKAALAVDVRDSIPPSNNSSSTSPSLTPPPQETGSESHGTPSTAAVDRHRDPALHMVSSGEGGSDGDTNGSGAVSSFPTPQVVDCDAGPSRLTPPLGAFQMDDWLGPSFLDPPYSLLQPESIHAQTSPGPVPPTSTVWGPVPEDLDANSADPGSLPPPPLSPGTENMLSLLFRDPLTPPLPQLTWDGIDTWAGRSKVDATRSDQGWITHWPITEDYQETSSQQWIAPVDTRSDGRKQNRWNGFVSALTRQTQILQQPNELAMYFPSIEQRSQFLHFYHETVNDLVVVPVPHSANPWIVNLSHMALGKAAGHEVLHDAFRYGLLSLASFDMGLKMRQGLRQTGYNAMYQSSTQQRDSALRLLHVAQVLKLFETDAVGADLALATVAAIAIRDRYAGSQDFEEPLKIAVSLIMDQGGAAAYLAKDPTPGRRFLVEQMACLEILGIFTTWDPPRLLSGDVGWFKEAFDASSKVTLADLQPTAFISDHITEVYGWDRDTIIFSAEIMNLADDMKAISALRSTYRKTSYPAIQSALEQRLAQLQSRYDVLSTKATKLRLQTSMARLHPRVAAGALLQQACMELLLHSDPEDESWKPVLYPKSRAILDLCDESISRGMYTGLLLPLTWAASTVDPQDRNRLQNLLRKLQPHYLVDPKLMQSVIDIDWTQMMDLEVEDWCRFMREKGFYVPFF